MRGCNAADEVAADTFWCSRDQKRARLKRLARGWMRPKSAAFSRPFIGDFCILLTAEIWLNTAELSHWIFSMLKFLLCYSSAFWTNRKRTACSALINFYCLLVLLLNIAQISQITPCQMLVCGNLHHLSLNKSKSNKASSDINLKLQELFCYFCHRYHRRRPDLEQTWNKVFKSSTQNQCRLMKKKQVPWNML